MQSHRRSLSRLLAAVLSTVAAAGSASSQTVQSSHKLADYVSTVKDLSETVRVVQSDTAQLARIGSDFGATYTLKTMHMMYLQPDRLRLDGNSPTRGTALMLLNGSIRYVDIPRFKIHLTENLEKSSSRRQSTLELEGILSPDTLTYLTGTYVRTEMLDGGQSEVFDLHYTGSQSQQHFLVWVDDRTRITVKRQWFDADKHLKATFSYDQPKEVSPGVWLPTRLQVQNSEGAIAAVIALEDVKVNTGLMPDLFNIPS